MYDDRRSILDLLAAGKITVDEAERLLATLALNSGSASEGSATALSAPLLDEGALERAERINEQMRGLLEHFDAHRFTRLNQQFHSVLFEPCPNPHILDLVHRGWGRLSGIRDSTFAFVPGRARHSVEEHDQILQLIRAGAEPLEIELAARRHRWRTLDAFLAARHTHTSEEKR